MDNQPSNVRPGSNDKIRQRLKTRQQHQQPSSLRVQTITDESTTTSFSPEPSPYVPPQPQPFPVLPTIHDNGSNSAKRQQSSTRSSNKDDNSKHLRSREAQVRNNNNSENDSRSSIAPVPSPFSSPPTSILSGSNNDQSEDDIRPTNRLPSEPIVQQQSAFSVRSRGRPQSASPLFPVQEVRVRGAYNSSTQQSDSRPPSNISSNYGANNSQRQDRSSFTPLPHATLTQASSMDDTFSDYSMQHRLQHVLGQTPRPLLWNNRTVDGRNGHFFASPDTNGNMNGHSNADYNTQSIPAFTRTASAPADSGMSDDHTNENYNLLPAVLHLKQELQATQTALQLLQNENKATSDRNNTYRSQLIQWEQYAEEQQRLCVTREGALQNQIEELQQTLINEKSLMQKQIDSYQQDLEISDTNRNELEKQIESLTVENSQAFERIHELQNEKDELASKHTVDLDRYASREIKLTEDLDATVKQKEQLQLQEEAVRKERNKLQEKVASYEEQLDTITIKYDQTGKELQQSRTREQKLQNENEKLEESLEANKEKSNAQGIEHDKVVKQLREELVACRKELQDCKTSASTEQQNLLSKLDTVETQLKLYKVSATERESTLRQQNESLESEVSAARVELKETTIEFSQKVKQLQANHDAERKAILEESKKVTFELDKLQAVHKETTRTLNKKVEESERVVADCTKEMSRLNGEINKLTDLVKTKSSQANTASNEAMMLQKRNTDLEKSLKQKEETMTAKANELDESVANLKQLLQNTEKSNAGLNKEIYRLRNELSALEKKSSEAETQTEVVQEADMGTQTDEVPTTPIATTEDVEIQTDPDVIDRVVHDSLNNTDVAIVANSTIADRLGRIRDAAERAQLEHRVRREMTRLKNEHQAEVQRLRSEHAIVLQKLKQDVYSEVQYKSKDQERQFKNEYEIKLKQLERQYNEELTKTRTTLEEALFDTEATLETTSAQLDSTTTELEREAAARERLEWTLRELERQMHVERTEWEHRIDQQTMQGRQAFLDETREMLENLQKEFNSAFDRQKSLSAQAASSILGHAVPFRRTHTATTVATSQPSPLSMTTETDEKKWDFGEYVTTSTTMHHASQHDSQQPSPSNSDVRSHTFTKKERHWKMDVQDIDKALDETEEMVRNLLRVSEETG